MILSCAPLKNAKKLNTLLAGQICRRPNVLVYENNFQNFVFFGAISVSSANLLICDCKFYNFFEVQDYHAIRQDNGRCVQDKICAYDIIGEENGVYCSITAKSGQNYFLDSSISNCNALDDFSFCLLYGDILVSYVNDTFNFGEMNTAYGLYFTSTVRVNNSNFYNNTAYEESLLYHYQSTCKISKINLIKNIQNGNWGLISGTTSANIDISDSYIRDNACNYIFCAVDSNCYVNVHYSNTQNNTMKKGEKNSANVRIDNANSISSVKFGKTIKYCNFNINQIVCNTIRYSYSNIYRILLSNLFLAIIV